MRPLSVQFLLPFAGVTGGIRAVVEIADRLHDAGHDVCLIWPSVNVCSRRNRLLRRLPGTRSLLRRNEHATLGWADPRCRTLEVEDLEARYLPEADVLVATAWQTAERALRMPPSKGRRVYFIQHYEVWSGPRHLVDRTWRGDFHHVVTAPWLRDLARERFGLEEVDLIPYGVDPELFRPEQEGRNLRRPGRLRVGLHAHRAPWKAAGEGMEAIRLARERGVPAVPVLFGLEPPDEEWPATGVEPEVHLDPPQERLRMLYSSMDVYLNPSHTETGPLPVLEAMACGTPVVATEVGSVGLWTEEGRHALLAPPGRPAALARHLERIYREPALAETLARGARERALRFTWDASARAMEDALRRALQEGRS